MPWYNPLSWGDESSSSTKKRNDLNYQGSEASGFANEGQDAFAQSRGDTNSLADALQKRANGQNLVSTEMLRQGAQQNVAGQISAAAGAAPGNSAMAARTAAIQGAKLGYGMSGQAVTAGLQEQQQAQNALAELLLRKRQQELEAALQSRQNATQAYGGVTPEKSPLEKLLPVINAGVGAYSAVTRRGSPPGGQGS